MKVWVGVWSDLPEPLIRALREERLVLRERVPEENVEDAAAVGEAPVAELFVPPWAAEVVRTFRYSRDNVEAGVLALRRGVADPEWRAAYEAAAYLSRTGAAEMVWALQEQEAARAEDAGHANQVPAAP